MLAALARDAVAPLLGPRTALTEADWLALGTRIAPARSVGGAQAGSAHRKAGGTAHPRDPPFGLGRTPRPRADPRQGPGSGGGQHRSRRPACALPPRSPQLLHNFVNFADFYAGTGWRFSRRAHSTSIIAPASCASASTIPRRTPCSPDQGGRTSPTSTATAANGKIKIAACFTAGDSDYLFVGRNGVFYDRQGRDWDATITKIVDSPISLRQAFWSPYKKFVRLLKSRWRSAPPGGPIHTDARVDRHQHRPMWVAPNHPRRRRSMSERWLPWGAAGAIGTFMTAIIGYATGLFQLGALAVVGKSWPSCCSSRCLRWCWRTSSFASGVSGRFSTPTGGR